MDNAVKLPIGIEDFEEIRTEGFYYVDKTGMITELLHNWGKVNLFTRPRRFGMTGIRLCSKGLPSPEKKSSVRNIWENSR